MDHQSKTLRMDIINQQIQELVGIYRHAISGTGVSENEFWIWYTLLQLEGSYSQQEICSMWSLSKQTVNTIVKNMVQKGWVTLSTIPGGHNRKALVLTEAGRIYGRRIVVPVATAEARAFDQLPAKDWEACSTALGNFIQILREEINQVQQEDAHGTMS